MKKEGKNVAKVFMLMFSVIAITLLSGNVKAYDVNTLTKVPESNIMYVDVTITDIDEAAYDRYVSGQSNISSGDDTTHYGFSAYRTGAIEATFTNYSNVTGLANTNLDGNGNIVFSSAVTKNVDGTNAAYSAFPTTDFYNAHRGIYGERLENWRMPFVKDSNGLYKFDSSTMVLNRVDSEKRFDVYTGSGILGFLPLNVITDNFPQATDSVNSDPNAKMGYAMKLTMPFTLNDSKTTSTGADLKFDFTGDDDVWIYIDGRLVIDLGGSHGAKSGYINFKTNTAYSETKKDNDGSDGIITNALTSSQLATGKHTLTMFYEERCAGAANFYASFNLMYGDVVTKYVDYYTGAEIASSVATKDGVDVQYTTSPKTISGYTLVETPSNATGKYIDGTITVTYKYKKNTSLTINHIDKNNSSIVLNSSVVSGLQGDSYSCSSSTFNGYRYELASPKTVTGNLAATPTTVNFYYLKESNVTTKYVDYYTNQEISGVSREKVAYAEGDRYSTTKKTINGYEFYTDSGNTSGTVQRSDIEVTYYYKKKSSVTIKYTDIKTNQDIVDPIVINGLQEDSYTSSEKSLDRYLFVRIDGSAEGKLAANPTTVTYYYIRRSKVTTKWVDEYAGIELLAPETITYSQDDPYTTVKEEIGGYEYSRDSGNTSGTVERTDIEVIYYYKRITSLTIRYVDEFSGELLERATVVEGLQNDAYTTAQKSFDSYVFDRVDGETSGRLSAEPTIITYYYIKQSDVKTKYVDYYTSREISDAESKTYNQGTDYTTNKKTIDGYTYFRDTENTSGRMGASDIEVTYYYKKNTSVTAKYLDYYTDDVIASDVVINGVEGDFYTTDIKTIVDYAYVGSEGTTNGAMTAEPQTVLYKYKKMVKVTTKYVNVNTGSEIADKSEIVSRQNDTYTTNSKRIENYTLTGDSGNTSGTTQRENIIVTYYYTANSSVLVKYIDINTGADILPQEVIGGLEGDNFTTTQKDISGYKYVGVEGQTSGSMGATGSTITYKYEKQSRVYVDFIDEVTGNNIEPQKSSIYSENQNYTTVPAAVEGYTCVGNSGNTTGTVQRQNIYVKYYYRKNSGVLARYLDYYTGESVAEDKSIDGIQGQEYETEQKDVSGYEFIEVIGLPKGYIDIEQSEVIYRYKKLSNLIVHHIDANSGEKIAEDTVTAYKQKDTYEAKPVNKAGYIIVEEPETKTGKMDREDIEKTYKYKQISGGLVVKYVDIKTGEVLDQKVYDGNAEDVIELEYKSIIQYFHVTELDPDFTEIVLTGQPQEVTYYYIRRSEVQFKGIDQDTGEQLYIATVEPTGVEGDTYKANPREVEGYTLVKTPDNATGVYQRVNPIVVFEYKKNAGSVNVKYVDVNTGNVLDQTSLSGNYGSVYRTEQKDFTGYKFVRVEGQISGTYEQEPKDVTYYYERITSKAIIKYVDENNNELLKEEQVGNLGETYTFELKEIDGYETVSVPNLTVTYQETDTTIIVRLKKKEEPVIVSGTVVVNLLDKDGNKIGESIVREDEVGKGVTITLPDIPGYTLTTERTVTATFIDGELVYNAVYEKIPEKVYGTIKVKFVDENGTELRSQYSSTDEVGKAFSYNAPQISGYTLTGNATQTATYTAEEQVLTFVYAKIPEKVYGTIVIKFVDEDGNDIKQQISFRNEEGKTIDYTAPEIAGYTLVSERNVSATYTSSEQVITVRYNKIPEKEYGKITVKYVDENGKEIKAATTYTGEVGTNFKATAPQIDGYELVGERNITDKYVTGEKTITVTYKVKEVIVEPDPKDDPTPEEPTKPQEEKVEEVENTEKEEAVNTGDIDLALMLVIAIASVLGIKLTKKYKKQ